MHRLPAVVLAAIVLLAVVHAQDTPSSAQIPITSTTSRKGPGIFGGTAIPTVYSDPTAIASTRSDRSTSTLVPAGASSASPAPSPSANPPAGSPSISAASSAPAAGGASGSMSSSVSGSMSSSVFNSTSSTSSAAPSVTSALPDSAHHTLSSPTTMVALCAAIAGQLLFRFASL